jgi:fucose permease
MITTMCWIGVDENTVEAGTGGLPLSGSLLVVVAVVGGALLPALQPAIQATNAHAHTPKTIVCIL